MYLSFRLRRGRIWTACAAPVAYAVNYANGDSDSEKDKAPWRNVIDIPDVEEHERQNE